MSRITWGPPTRHSSTGDLGARAFVSVEYRGWQARHEFDTHGKSSSEVARHVAQLEARHELLVERLDELQALVGREITVGEIAFRITGATIPPRSQKAHDLVIGIRRVDGEQFAKVEGWPLRLRLASIDDCPTNEEILAVVLERLGQQTSVQTAHEAFVAKVTAKLA